MAAGRRVKEEGAGNDLLERIGGDPLFAAVHGTFDQLLDPARFVGRAPEQVAEFLEECVDPILRKHSHKLEKTNVDNVNV